MTTMETIRAALDLRLAEARKVTDADGATPEQARDADRWARARQFADEYDDPAELATFYRMSPWFDQPWEVVRRAMEAERAGI